MSRYAIHVVPHGTQWAVIREGDDVAVSLHETRAEAAKAGSELARDGEVTFEVHDRDGAGDEYDDDPRSSES